MLLILFLAVAAEAAVLRPRQVSNNNNNNTYFPQFPGGFPQYPQGFPQYPPGFPQPPSFPGSNQIPYYPQPQPEPSQQAQSGVQRDTPVLVPTNTPIPIVKSDFQPNLGDGKYQYSYETGNGIQAEERGSQRLVGEPAEAGTVAQGSYSYTDPDGNLIQVTYTADENGFVPQGSHFPTAPPVPPEILAALEKNAAEEAAQNGGVISPSFHHFFRSLRTRHH
ncbi:endocuticle structural glycoprotein SgAbd-8 [Halyomorpha halys]|uniref:endocuticle structural glycoprotein SgAbd-8 n=1 Tax=Halyomorpha halys TaxID=286706 RepID=UPI0006D4FF86